MQYLLRFFPHNKFLTIILLILIVFAFSICFYQLGKAPLDNWDEAWYGEITKTMLKSKNFIIPIWNGSPLYEKPPLYMWISAFFSLFFGLNEFSLRLTSAISGFIIICGTVGYSYKK